MEIEDFLEHNVEGYLFYDLTALAPSGVGYPWLMTSFGGIELFGALLSQRSFDHSRSEAYFVSYWSKHLYRERDRTVAQGRALYKLVRHGIAHSFIPKGPIHVAGQNGWRHLTVDPAGNLFVDPERLADDLKMSYFRDVRPVLRKSTGRVSRTTMCDEPEHRVIKGTGPPRRAASAHRPGLLRREGFPARHVAGGLRCMRLDARAIRFLRGRRGLGQRPVASARRAVANGCPAWGIEDADEALLQEVTHGRSGRGETRRQRGGAATPAPIVE